MKTALTIMEANGHISPMFDAARRIMVLSCCRRVSTPAESYDFPAVFSEKLSLLHALGIRMLICGAISNEDAATLEEQGIQVCSFTSGPWQEVWQEWRCHRQLTSLHMLPGCCCRRQNCRQAQFSSPSPEITDQSNRKDAQ